MIAAMDDEDLDVAHVRALIEKLPLPAQQRVHVVHQILIDLLNSDKAGEVELAFTLAMAELAARK